MDGRPRPHHGLAPGEEDRPGNLRRLRGHRGRDVAARHVHARLPGERPDDAAPGLPAWQSRALARGRASQHLSLLRQGSRRAGLVGVHRLRDARRSSSRSVESDGPAGAVPDPRFATNEARVANQDALDAIVGRWVRPRRRYDVMHRCQEAGIIAAVVQSAEDRVEYDPQLKHRDMHPVIDSSRRSASSSTRAIRSSCPGRRPSCTDAGRCCASTTATSTASCSA